ncbi:unnamed protein product, partial [Meganyctiphanes norvegica]
NSLFLANCFKTSEPRGAVKLQLSDNGSASLKPTSVYTLMKTQASEWSTHTALAIKRDNKWCLWTYAEYFEESQTVAKAFIKLGLERFHGVCIMGFNSPEWVIANFGCIFAGGLSAGVYTTNNPEACRHLADNCEAQIIVVENTECLDQFLAVKRFLPNIKAIVQWSGIPGAPGVLSWAELLAIGKAETEDALNHRLKLAAINQCCTLIYTSGTTGPPKGVMCNQDHLTWIGTVFQDILGIKSGQEVAVSYLPLSHLAAQALDVYLGITIAATIYFAQPDALKGSLVLSLQEVQPTVFLGVPRVWEKIYEKMQEVSSQTKGVRRQVATWAKYHGLNYYNAMIEDRYLSFYEQMSNYLAKSLILTKVKEKIGLSRSSIYFSGAAPISAKILEYFMSLDIPVMEAYAMSESMAVCTFNLPVPGGFRLGSVGKVIDATEVKLDYRLGIREGEGEILMKGRNVCMGYLRMPEKTNETIDEDGWLHSGDIGKFDSDGFLYITGRIKELVITAGGENIPPVLIEEAVKLELPFISYCMLIGDKRKYLTVLLTMKSEVNLATGEPLSELSLNCRTEFKKIGSSAVTVDQVLAEVKNDPQGPIASAINAGIERYNVHHAASHAQTVKRWTILPHDFTLPTGELNNTLKLKRTFVLDKYAQHISDMYDRTESIPLLSKL